MPARCHRYDFLVCLWNGLTFFELFKLFILHLGLITTPHVHMTYVYSFLICFSHDHVAKRSHYRIMIFYMTSEYY